MTPLSYFALVSITIVSLVALDQIQLVQDLITASGYSSSEVLAGLAGILVIIYTAIYVLSFRSK